MLFQKSPKKEKKAAKSLKRTPFKPSSGKKKAKKSKPRMAPTKSSIQSEKVCYLCGAVRGGLNELKEHHCISGTANRRMAEKYGLKVWLCNHDCHIYGPKSPHQCKETSLMLHQVAQRKFEETHTREEFMEVFKKNWL